MQYLGELQGVVDTDLEVVKRKDKEYGASWKKRGGIGAFMMLARKWDRLENALRPDVTGLARLSPKVPAWDIITAALVDSREEGILDDIRDLRRYLLLVEAEILAQGCGKVVTLLSSQQGPSD